MKKILVPTDFSEHADNALSVAAQIARDNNSEIKTSGLDATKATTKSEFSAGATEKSLQINK